MGASSTGRILLLTGKPGTGKTGLIMRAVAGAGLRAGGFYTEEIRSRGTREGFRIVTLDGQQAVLAHVGIPGPYRVSRYGVDLDALNSTAVPAVRSAVNDAELVVIDEIGKMELISTEFCDAVMQALDSGKRVLGTVMLNPHPVADRVKRHPEARTIVVTGDNRAEVEKAMSDWLTTGHGAGCSEDLTRRGPGQ